MSFVLLVNIRSYGSNLNPKPYSFMSFVLLVNIVLMNIVIAVVIPTPYTLHPTPYTLHPTP